MTIKKDVNLKRQKKVRQLIGTALRSSKEKTVLVVVNSMKMHPKYMKRYIVSKKMLVHTEINVEKGQTVKFNECRPISRKKSWKVVEVK